MKSQWLPSGVVKPVFCCLETFWLPKIINVGGLLSSIYLYQRVTSVYLFVLWYALPQFFNNLIQNCHVHSHLYQRRFCLPNVSLFTPANVETGIASLAGSQCAAIFLYTTSLMGQQRMTGLALMHINYGMDLDLNDIVDIFTGQHPRRMFLLLLFLQHILTE